MTNRLGEYIAHELEVRCVYIDDLAQRTGLSFRVCLRAIANNVYPKELKDRLVVIFGFSSWNELTQAAMSAVEV